MPEPRPSGAARTAALSANPETNHRSWSLLTGDDIHLFNEGTHARLYLKLGAHPMPIGKPEGTYFAVWAPNAESVSVLGDFNGWDRTANPLTAKGSSGIWEGFVPGVLPGAIYKFRIESRFFGYGVDKADPFAFSTELPPRTGSMVADLSYEWGDAAWMRDRRGRNSRSAPISIYELHLGSWMRVPEEGNRSLTYLEMAPRLIDYITRLGFTHVELLPVMEHPFYGSWGYQTAGYFAPTRRYGDPQGLMYLIDQLHQAGIGVILDWVPSHFPTDEHGLSYFDGTHLFEHADRRQGFQPDWGSLVFNYDRNEVRSFLTSSAMFWLDKYHIDGLRVDAVASMLYLDYSRKANEWIPNQYGGNENLAAIAFLRRLNEDIYREYPDTQTYAEESTAWPMVSKPTYLGGLGFGMKWDMGWMHDTLEYISRDPVHRKFHHGQLTFRMVYAFSENFVLPLSHDEVVHGKGSLLGKMPGDDWRRFANLRLLFAYMYAQPAKKLLFMGCEFGQPAEWNHDTSLQWHLLEHASHRGIQRFVEDLNRTYRNDPALHALDLDQMGFEWVDANDQEQSALAFLRHGGAGVNPVLAVFNFTPLVRHNYRIGVPHAGFWKEILNSDAEEYWGSGQGNFGGLNTAPLPFHGRHQSINATLPPLGAVFFRFEGAEG